MGERMTPEQIKTVIASVYALYKSEGTTKDNEKLTDFVETLIPELALQEVTIDQNFVPDWITEQYPLLNIENI